MSTKKIVSLEAMERFEKPRNNIHRISGSPAAQAFVAVVDQIRTASRAAPPEVQPSLTQGAYP